MGKSVLRDKSYLYAIEIVNLSRQLQSDNREYILSKQLVRSGTSIGALVREAQYAQSKPDFIHKMNVALKEANENEYWIELLKDTGYITEIMHHNYSNKCRELIRMLISTIKTAKDSTL